MNEMQIIRTATLELQSLDDTEVVKIAGVLQRIKNWWQAFKSPQYRKQVQQLKQESTSIKDLINSLSNNITDLQKAISSNDVQMYGDSLNKVRHLASQLISDVSSYQQTAEEAHQAAPEKLVDVEVPRRQKETRHTTKDELKDPNVKKKLIAQLPKEYDLAFGRQRTMVSDSKWMQQFTSEDVHFMPGPATRIITDLAKALERYMDIDEQEALALVAYDRRKLLNNISEALLKGGQINNVDFSKVSDEVTHRPANQMKMFMSAYNIPIPGTDILFDIPNIVVIDLLASFRPSKKLSIYWTDHIRISSPINKSYAMRSFEFLKLAARIDNVKLKYPNIAEHIDDLKYGDPSGNDKYLEWMARQLNEGFRKEDIIPTVNFFHKHLNKFENKDINQYKNLKELEDIVKKIDQAGSLSENKKKSKEGGVKIWENPNYVLIRLDTKDACQIYGAGTRWCITMTDANYYEAYKSENSIIYMLVSKVPQNNVYDKVAFQYDRGINNEILNLHTFTSDDEEIDPYEIDVYPAIKGLMESDVVNQPMDLLAKYNYGLMSEAEELDFFNSGDAYASDLIATKTKSPILQLELAKNGNKSIIDSLITNVNLNHEAQLVLLNRCNKTSECQYLAENPSITPEVQKYLFDRGAKDTNRVIIYGLAINPKLAPEIQQMIFDYNDAYIIEYMAENPSLTPEMQLKLIDVSDKDTLLYLSKNPSLTQEAREMLINKGIIELEKLAAQQQNIHQWARDILTQAFRQTMGREPTVSELQLAQAVSWHESNYGRGWRAAKNPDGRATSSNNWGAVQSGMPKGNACPINSFMYTDTHPTSAGVNVPYQVCFKTYPTPVDGAADVVRLLFKSKSRGPGITEAARAGSVNDFSTIMYDTKYYEGWGKTREERIAGHANRMRKTIQTISTALNEKPQFNDMETGASKVPATIDEQKDIMNEYEQLIPMLLAASDRGPVEKLVKQAIEKSELPTTNILIHLGGDASFASMVKFARITTMALREEFGAISSIYENGESVEIESDITGSEHNVVRASRALVAGLVDAFKDINNIAIEAEVKAGDSSNYNLLTSKVSEECYRKFAMERLSTND